jgi:CRP-like cAMP-binding protein
MQPTSQVADIVGGVIALLLIATVVRAVTRRLKLPFTVVLVLVGIGLSVLAAAHPHVLLSGRQPRNATVTAVTPCTLYKLHQNDLEVAMVMQPAIRKALEEESHKRLTMHYAG